PLRYSFWSCTSTIPTPGTRAADVSIVRSGREHTELSRSSNRSNGFHVSIGSSIDTFPPTPRRPAKRSRSSGIGQPLPNGPHTNTTSEARLGHRPPAHTPPPTHS